MSIVDYTTEAKVFLKIPDNQDDLAEFLLASVEALIERDTGRNFDSVEKTLVLSDARDVERYRLKDDLFDFGFFPVQTVTATSGDVKVISPFVSLTNYVLPTTLTLTVGYASAPADIKQATLEILKYNLNRFNAQQFGVQSVGMDNVSISYQFEVPLSARKILDGYRTPTLW